MTLRRHTAHCSFGGGRPCGSTLRHPALPSAPARCRRLARLWGTMLPPSLPCLLGPSALRPARAHCGAIRQAVLPLCPPLCPSPLALPCLVSARSVSPCPAPRPWLQGLRPPFSLSLSLCSLASSALPPPPGPRQHGAEQFAKQPSLPAPPLCSRFLAPPCPLCARSPSSSLAPLPRPLGPWPSVSLSPSSLYPPGIHIAEQYARHPSHSLFTLPPPGALVPGLVARMSHCTRLRPLSLHARPASFSLPCPFPSLPHAGHYAGHCVGKSHACRRHASGPRCMTLRRTLHLSGWTALWQRAVAPRLVQCPRALRVARSVVGYLFAAAPRLLFHAAVACPLPCPAISVPLPSGQREHDAEQFARQRSLFAPSLCPGPWPCPAPCLLALPCPPLPPFPGPLVPGPLSLCPRHPFTRPAYTSRSNTRGTPPTPSSPCRPLVPWSLGLWHARRNAPACGLCPSTPALPPPPSPALFPLYTTQDTTQDTV